MNITVFVEGDTDIPFVTKLCDAAGFEVRTPMFGRHGKGDIDKRLPGLMKAAKGSPHLVVRDLDQDAACASEWMAKHALQQHAGYFCLRLAVRAVEAWFLADRKHAAHALRVKETRIPLVPEHEEHPKLTIVELARHSTRPLVRQAIVPQPGAHRPYGAGYSGWLIEAAEGWSLEAACKHSDSLDRARRRLVTLREKWESGRSEPMA